jgi:hypothetical protein
MMAFGHQFAARAASGHAGSALGCAHARLGDFLLQSMVPARAL